LTSDVLYPRCATTLTRGQFIVRDSKNERDYLLVEDRHVAQGFARRPELLAVLTVLDIGTLYLLVSGSGILPPHYYDRVYQLPLSCPSRVAAISILEFIEPVRLVPLACENVLVTVAQRLLNDDEIEVHLHIEPNARGIEASRVVYAADLDPELPLLETTDVMPD
jgi:hypothetical protein